MINDLSYLPVLAIKELEMSVAGITVANLIFHLYQVQFWNNGRAGESLGIVRTILEVFFSFEPSTI